MIQNKPFRSGRWESRTLASVFIALWFTNAFVQTTSGQSCATIVPARQSGWEQTRRVLSAEQTIAQAADPTCPWYVPLYVHIVRNDDGSEGLGLDELTLSLMQADTLLDDYGIRVFQHGAIDYIDDGDFAYLDGCGEDELLRQFNTAPDVINVYFVPNFTEKRCIPLDASTIGECCEGGGDCPTGWFCALDADHNCGRSTYSQSDDTPGVIVCNEGATNGSTLAHEIGHFFDLFHTHETANGMVECPDGSNCDVAGDLVCDTPADPNLSGHTDNCVYDDYADPPDGCDNTAYAPDTSNVMSYAPKVCRSIFTAGQIARFFETWEMTRTELFTRTWYVATGSGAEGDGTPSLPLDQVSDAVGAAQDGDHLFIKSGNYPEDLLINTQMTIRRWDSSGSVLIGSN